VHHGSIGKHERGPECDARPDVDAAEQRRHIVSDRIEALDGFAAFIEHARVAVG